MLNCVFVCDHQFNTTALFDETVVSDFMRPTSWKWLSVRSSRQSSSRPVSISLLVVDKFGSFTVHSEPGAFLGKKL
jgi:hypothetical protein